MERHQLCVLAHWIGLWKSDPNFHQKRLFRSRGWWLQPLHLARPGQGCALVQAKAAFHSFHCRNCGMLMQQECQQGMGDELPVLTTRVTAGMSLTPSKRSPAPNQGSGVVHRHRFSIRNPCEFKLWHGSFSSSKYAAAPQRKIKYFWK